MTLHRREEGQRGSGGVFYNLVGNILNFLRRQAVCNKRQRSIRNGLAYFLQETSGGPVLMTTLSPPHKNPQRIPQHLDWK